RLLLLAIAAYIVVSYLSDHDVSSAPSRTESNAAGSTSPINRLEDINLTYDNKRSFPLPDAHHPVIRMSSLRYLKHTERGHNDNYIATLKSRGVLHGHNDIIVLRYRANTSTILEPRPDAGRITAISQGQTGNQMFLYVSLHGIARRNGMHPVISANNLLLKLFDLNVTVVQSNRPGRDWIQFCPDRYRYDRRTEYLDPRIDVELVGNLINWRYSRNVLRYVVQNHFRFRETIQQEADNFLWRSMSQFGHSPPDVAVIAVHIRRTDRITWLIKRGRPNSMPDRMYFSHAVAFFNRLFNNKTMFIVCSDDVKWSKVNFITERPTVFSVGHSAEVDFAILSRCNHSILSIGTFGRWSAIMAGGVTVYHKVGSPTDVPLDAAYRKVNSTKNPEEAWIALS
ncbi:Galactoside 2-alpha-L-fucosyltransferase 2, partial [Lamellibrachia satsuma]